MSQSHANATHMDANSLYLADSENVLGNKRNAEVPPLSQERSHAVASERTAYPFSVEDAERYFRDHGYAVAQRTISFYCQQNKFRCKKFPANGVRRWFLQKGSLDQHIEQMRRDGHATASPRKQLQRGEETAQTKTVASPHATASSRMREPTEEDTSQPKANARSQERSHASAIFETITLPRETYELITNELGEKNTQVRMLHEQMRGMLERDKETNVLIQQLQQRLLPPEQPERDAGDN